MGGTTLDIRLGFFDAAVVTMRSLGRMLSFNESLVDNESGVTLLGVSLALLVLISG